MLATGRSLVQTLPMDIETYLKERGERKSAFADRLGVQPSTVTRLVQGVRKPSGRLLMKIIKATDGKVRISDFQWEERP